MAPKTGNLAESCEKFAVSATVYGTFKHKQLIVFVFNKMKHGLESARFTGIRKLYANSANWKLNPQI